MNGEVAQKREDNIKYRIPNSGRITFCHGLRIVRIPETLTVRQRFDVSSWDAEASRAVLCPRDLRRFTSLIGISKEEMSVFSSAMEEGRRRQI
jgi:hypothetical protein